jgi:hypothetical protein
MAIKQNQSRSNRLKYYFEGVDVPLIAMHLIRDSDRPLNDVPGYQSIDPIIEPL